MNKTYQILSSLLGVQFSGYEYYAITDDVNRPYNQEVAEEAQRIFDSPKNFDRSFDDCFKRSRQGKVVEAYLRENYPDFFFDNPTKYHDIISDDDVLVECKNWKTSNIPNEIMKFAKGSLNWNKCDYLVICTYNTDGTIYFHTLLSRDELEKIAKGSFVVKKTGKSYTISDSQVASFYNHSQSITFIDGDTKITKSSDWFLKNMRSGSNGVTQYVFHTDLI